MYWIILLELF